MVTDAPVPEKGPRGFIGYAETLEDEVYDFQVLAYPHRTPALILPNWRWMFVESARRLASQPWVWMYRKAQHIVAHQGAIPVQLKLGDREHLTGWFVETMAAEEIRGSPIGPMVIKKALDELPFNLSLGQTEQMRQLQYAMGWQKVKDLNTWLFVTAWGMNLRSQLPPIIAPLAALVLAAWHKLRLSRRQRQFREQGWTTEIIESFDECHDALWKEVSAQFPVAVVRDASYFNWKYVDRPQAEFTRINVLRDGQLRACAVVMMKAADEIYQYPRGFIVDLLVAPRDATTVSALLVAALDVLAAQSAVTVTCLLGHDTLEQSLKDFGFLFRGPRHQLLVSSGDLSSEDTALLLDPSAWLVSMGDSDVDAYAG